MKKYSWQIVNALLSLIKLYNPRDGADSVDQPKGDVPRVFDNN